jgi:hypothetical protein
MAATPFATVPVWRLEALRTELADLAFELECQGRRDAADVTNMVGIRLAELAGEATAAPAPAQAAPLLSS